MNKNAQKIIDTCNNLFEANKGDCNRFAIAVATEFNIVLSGLADDIVDEIQAEGWTMLNDGVEAKEKADDGWFVIGGLKAVDTVPTIPKPQPTHGHVVIVLSGQLANEKYPTAIWGSIDGILPEAGENTVNYAWNKNSRDKVVYACKQLS